MIKVALIGCGRVALKSHLPAWEKVKNAKIVAVCDNIRERTEKVANQYGITSTYSSYKGLLEKEDVDLIDIAAPSDIHAKMAIQAASYNKHCIVEKPLAMTLHDADKIIRAFKTKNLKLTVVMQNRYNPSVQFLKKELSKGSLGKILLGNVTVRWTRPQTYYDNTWQGKYLSGGTLINQSIHHIDALLWMFDKKVTSVFAYMGTLNHKMLAEDAAAVVLKFEDNTLACIEASVLAYPHNLEGSLTLLCEKGSVKIGGVALNEISFWNTQISEKIKQPSKKVKKPADIYGTSHAMVFRDMISAIKDNRSPSIRGEDGRMALEVILAAYKSAATGKEIYL